jgi:excisionase family DNA binding protein
MGRLLTVAEVSRALKVSPSLIYGEVRQGRLSHVRIGDGTIRISEDHLQAYIDAREVVASIPTTKGRVASRERRGPTAFRHLDVSRLPVRRT